MTAGQHPGQRRQDRPLSPGQPRCPYLALEYNDLVTEDKDLNVLGAIGPGEQAEPAEYPDHRQIGESD
jgi:hypothetical protein